MTQFQDVKLVKNESKEWKTLANYCIQCRTIIC